MEIKRRLMVNNTFGLHSRPASEVVKLAQKFNSETFLYKVYLNSSSRVSRETATTKYCDLKP